MEGAERRRVELAVGIEKEQRARWGQFFTAAPLAALLASFFDLEALGDEASLLDPGAGMGALTTAFVERVAEVKPQTRLSLTAVEVDPGLSRCLEEALNECREALPLTQAARYQLDFISWAADRLAVSAAGRTQFDCIIMNPPYRKIHSSSPERTLLHGLGIETTNLYTAFLTLAVRLLAPGGQLVAITPRSFCNGAYFRGFRRDLLSATALRRIHLFGSRIDAFRDSDVLQENVVFHAIEGEERNRVIISASDGHTDDWLVTREAPYEEVVRTDDPQHFIYVVPDSMGATVVEQMGKLEGTLTQVGIEVSTGRVVDFRAREHLRSVPARETAPLVYPGHISEGRVRWPEGAPRKPKAIKVVDETAPLLMPKGTYVVVKRFTSKEEPRRVVAAIYDPSLISAEVVGFENHLNVYHRRGEGLPPTMARGLAAFLNSTMADLYFRLFNGHTQINATDLRRLRYPSPKQLESLGRAIGDTFTDQRMLDRLVQDYVPELAERAGGRDPLILHQRIWEALDVLKRLDFPRGQQNERSALTLLALLDMTPDKSWSDASAPLRGITQMMGFFDEHYGKKYAPNTRETVRRQTVHQFIAAGLTIQNPDKPDRPTNSGQTVYQIEQNALDLIQSYGTRRWDKKLTVYRTEVESLRKRWAAEREMKRIPVVLPEGGEVFLSPGGQSVLITEVVQAFCPRFTPGGSVLYIGDTDDKFAVFEQDTLRELGITIEEHGKMPDLIVYRADKNWLVLVEAVTSHGPMNPKRREELAHLFGGSQAALVYVTAFLDRKTLGKYIDDISWETEVWVAENPSHLIHFNGERFLGPPDA
jgi:adenine-specific DNA-methyltransferase